MRSLRLHCRSVTSDLSPRPSRHLIARGRVIAIRFQRLQTALTLAILLLTLSSHSAKSEGEVKTAELDALFETYSRPDSPGASVMVIHNGKIVAAKGYGLANLETKTPCGTNTNFRLASVTKQFTAMAVLILADQGKLKLDERLTDFFPEFPAYGKQITVHQLLTHTSGLLDYEDLI